ncbi:hypothetical protein ACOHPB_003454, partial [Cronobacter sakazakii]
CWRGGDGRPNAGRTCAAVRPLPAVTQCGSVRAARQPLTVALSGFMACTEASKGRSEIVRILERLANSVYDTNSYHEGVTIMAVIQPKDSLNKKKFQFQVPAPILAEYKEKKELLESYNQRVDISDDLVKALKDAIKQMDKHLAELTTQSSRSDVAGQDKPVA